MTTLGLMNNFPFISAIPQSYPINSPPLSTNIFQFPPNSPQISLPGLTSMPFINGCDLMSQLVSAGSFNMIGDIDMINGDQVNGDSNLAIRIIMSGKEVGSIIGKRGDNIKRFREESMARINISDGNSPERIVTISGSCDQIYNAVGLMCRKLQDDAMKISDKLTDSKSMILSIRLLIQPVQYSGIMVNGGCKITQLKEISNATILFGIEFLPHSSERLITISGSSESIAKCILELCKILTEIPYSTYLVPYSPKPVPYPVMPQTVVTNGPNKVASPGFGDNMPVPNSLPLLPIQNLCPQYFYSDQIPYPIGLPVPLIPLKMQSPLSPYLQKPPYDTIWKSSSTNGGQQLPQQNVSREFFVENEMIGCIIGRGGSTINEIRAISGAQIKISNCEDGKLERKITICGGLDAVETAQMLINSRITLELLRWHF